MLQTLYSNFLEMSFEAQELFVRAYRERRTNETEAVKRRREASYEGTSTRVALSDEEKALMKKLGLTLSAARDIRNDTEEVEEEDGVELFED